MAEASQSLKQLAKQRTWLKLGLYEADGISYKSAIHTESFFLSQLGRTNPEAELDATIQAINKPFINEKNSKSHALCRFPARVIWLKKNSTGSS
ncbi:MAG: hypothetical protein Q9M92_08800 [Enterobacterales bacterium]|nr:hypothetical protein [Enterobacterales bacterium]